MDFNVERTFPIWGFIIWIIYLIFFCVCSFYLGFKLKILKKRINDILVFYLFGFSDLGLEMVCGIWVFWIYSYYIIRVYMCRGERERERGE